MYSGLRTVVINDLHSGSDLALKSPKASKSEDDTTSPMNKGQEILYDFYDDLTTEWANPDGLIVNGDALEGLQKKSNMTGVWSDNLKDQAEDAIRLIQKWKAKKIYFIRGTPYHTQTSGVDMEEYIAERLGAVRLKGLHSAGVRLINLAPPKAPERIFHVTHHIGGTKRWQYRGTEPSARMAMLMLNESHWIDRKHHSIFGIMRAHVHHYWYTESASRVMLVNPAWQLMTPYAVKIMAETPAEIGATRFTFYNDGMWHKEHRILKPDKLRLPIEQVV